MSYRRIWLRTRSAGFKRAIASALFALAAAFLGSHDIARADEAAWEHLKNGGIVLFRHTLAPGTGDPDNFTLGDCSTQRNLNETGRQDARKIGQAFRDRGIAVGDVLTSQWCRCVDTAELAFPGQVTEQPAFNSFFQNRAKGPEQTDAARDLLSNWSGEGALVVVTHQVNITALTNIFPTSGEGIVINIHDGEIGVVGRIQL